MPSSHTLDPVYFGKLPRRGDFVRHNASRPSVRALDDWLQRGLHEAKTRRSRFQGAFDAAPACCFFFSPREVPGALIGVMHPSRDQSGRRYPFFVALDAGGRSLRTRHTARIPVQLGAFFEEARVLARDVVEGELPPREITERLSSTELPLRSDTPPLRDYKRYLRQTPLERLWKQLWVHPDEGRKRLLLKKLIDVLRPWQDRIPTRLSYGLQFPLVAGEQVGSYTTSFWWEACFRLLRFPDVAPTCFWNATSEVPSRPPSLLFFLRPPPAGAFAPLFAEERDSESVYALDGQPAPDAEAAAPELPAPYEHLLDNGRLTLWDFLCQL